MKRNSFNFTSQPKKKTNKNSVSIEQSKLPDVNQDSLPVNSAMDLLKRNPTLIQANNRPFSTKGPKLTLK